MARATYSLTSYGSVQSEPLSAFGRTLPANTGWETPTLTPVKSVMSLPMNDSRVESKYVLMSGAPNAPNSTIKATQAMRAG